MQVIANVTRVVHDIQRAAKAIFVLVYRFHGTEEPAEGFVDRLQFWYALFSIFWNHFVQSILCREDFS